MPETEPGGGAGATPPRAAAPGRPPPRGTRPGPLRRLLLASLALGVVASAGGALWMLRSLGEAGALVNHTREVIAEAAGVVGALVEAEAGQRGFLLTGAEGYLGQYEGALGAVRPALERLGALVAGKPDQAARLPAIREAAEARLALLQETLARYRGGDPEGALALLRAEAGLRRMDALRAGVAAFAEEERRLLGQRIAAESRGAALTAGLVGFAALLAACIAALVALGAARSQREARERAERALSREEARYRALTEGTTQLTWVMRPDATLAFVSRSYREYTGLAAPEVAAAEWRGIVHPEDRARAEAEVARALARGEGFELEHRLRRADGAWRWMQSRAEPVRDPQGRAGEWMGTTLDMHDRREAEAALREREARFRTLFTSIDEGYCLAEIVLDAEGRPADYRFLEANPPFEAMSGLRDAVGRTALELVPGLERHWIETYARVALGGEPVRFQQGSEAMGRWFDVFATPVAPRGRFAAVFRDMSERRRTERALAENAARFRAMAENIPQLAWMARPDGWIFWYNRRWFDVTGTTPEEMEGWGWRSVHHPDHVERVVERFRAAIASEQPWEDTFPLRTADGTWRWFLSRARAVRDAAGRVELWFGTNTDITEARQAEAALSESAARFRAVFENAGVGMARIACEDGRLVEVNDALCRMLGRGRAELRASSWGALTHPEERDGVLAEFGRVAAGEIDGRTVEQRCVHADGHAVWARLTLSVVRDAEGGPDYAVAVVEDVSERRAAEERLRSGEAQLRTIVDTVPVGLIMAELPSGRIVSGNRQVEAILRHPVLHSPDLHSYEEWVAFHPDGRRVASREFPLARMVEPGEENPSLEVHYQRGDGSRAWIRIVGRPVRNAAGEVVGGVVALLDVDGERRAREELAAQEATLRATIAQAPFPILLHAEDGEILQASGAWQEISGWRWPEDIRSIADWTERAYGGRRDDLRGYIETLYALDRRVDEGDYRIQTKHDGERVWSFGSAPVGRDARGRRLVVSMAADVTDLRRAEAELGRVLAEQRAIYANAPVGLAAHDRELRFIAVNERLAEMNGVPMAAHFGRTPRAVVPQAADAVEPLIRRVLETGEPVPELEIETATAAHPAERRFYLASYYPVRAEGTGEVEGVSIAVLDIHARKRAEAALRDLTATLEGRVEERTRALTDTVAELNAFAYTVSHDLRAPLRGMEGFAQALLEDHAEALGPAGRRYAERIVAAAQRMDGLIGDLLEYSRLSRAEVTLRPADPAAVAEGALADVREAVERRGATVEIARPMPRAVASPPVLRQVLANLLGNAVKFVPPGETPHVRVGAEPREEGAVVRIWVEDNGIGIAPEYRERIFRVFERLHADSVYPGTGIGLAIVRRCAERMGGAAGVEGRADGGRGSRFWVELPAAPPGPEQQGVLPRGER